MAERKADKKDIGLAAKNAENKEGKKTADAGKKKYELKKNAGAEKKKYASDKHENAKKKIDRRAISLLLLSAVLIISASAYFAVKNTDFAEEGSETETQVLYVSADSITGIAWENADGESLSFTRSGEEWSCDGDAERNINKSSIDAIAATACDIKSADVINSPKDISVYGLSEPSLTITLSLEDGTKKKLMAGSQNELTYDYYLMIDGDSNVYTVDSLFMDSFTFDIESLTRIAVSTDSEAEEEE